MLKCVLHSLMAFFFIYNPNPAPPQKKGAVKTRLALKPETTKEEVVACLKNGFGVDDSMYSLLKEYQIKAR